MLAIFALGVAMPLAGQEQARIGSVRDALGVSGTLAGSGGPASVNWIEGGERFSYTTRGGERGPEVLVYDPETLADQVLFDARTLTLPGTAEPIQYRSFEFADDSRNLVFQTNFRPIYRNSGLADFYIYSLDTETLRMGAKDARTADLSPDGTRLGFERGGNLYVVDLETSRETQLTDVDGDSVFNGVFDWVYEEEFGFAQAWKWSPDSRRIAYWQTDERGVPVIQLTDWEDQHPDWFRINYPKVGDENPEVRIGVVDVGSGETRWLDTGLEEEHYIPRIYWTSDPNTLAVVTLNRPQNHLRLFFFDVRTGERRLVMEERSDAWIDVYDFFAGIEHFFTFPEGLREFFWVSDRDGYNHLYRYGYDGELLNQVTEGDWVVTRVEGIDPETRTLYYTSTEESPLERHLYAIGFDGTGKRRLTETRGTHSIDMGPNGRYYIDRWSNTETPRQVELWTTADGGRKLATLEDNASVREHIGTHAYSPLELFRFTTSDGQELDGSMIRPPDFDPSREYPVLLSIYGGPGSQQVYDAWASNGWHQYLAQQGYIVVGLNNRGSGNYGRDFMEIVYGELGKWEANDFAEVGRWLASQPWVDGSRMAIQGTSYGGFMAIATLLRHPGVFALGMANSPVTDWRLYDTIYTERYMGLLSENADGYARTSLVERADQLQGYLLLVHSGLDENVHPQNTMQMLTALARAGKDAELRFYPPGAHGAAFDTSSRITMTEVYTNLLCEH
ncbi:MAG: alpha/beta fold hydrolase, partial [Gemmatimonadetes bacterium]|nr:S9 family peptidase [Gemmatimonadota bacterium]NIQ53965.1 S9 family peptidase [Gemmatimonadota bacterium]NIU74146.1 alpha/beta fold hydrolase [Gammaproteobacteria bacterium]NIX45621.1 alpha/beta fold hydrolase [Gemmatimonadota bacterium]NIY08413.1 alpha/beta fold hydrolase [Gemmatimonadota bacterium]